MTFRTVDYSKLAASVPINKDAAVAFGGKGETFETRALDGALSWDLPPPLRAIPAIAPRLVGLRKGSLTVVGLLDAKASRSGAAWVVRCICGKYTTRTARALRNPINLDDKCGHCMHIDQLRKLGSNPKWMRLAVEKAERKRLAKESS